MSKVTVVDYGVGNLQSVIWAFEHAGGHVQLSSDPKEVANAERLVLPGVGAFGSCMDELHARNLVEPVMQFAATGRPFMGICVGMQIMLSIGEEFGEHAGLGFIPGRVQAIPKEGTDGRPQALPYIGWASLKSARKWQGTLLQDLQDGDYVYCLHSFSAHPEAPEAVLAQYDYNGHKITAAIAKDNLTGFQFHPEKSGETGLRIIRRFLL